MQPLDLKAHGHAQFGVEVGQRFVEQKDLRFAYDRAAHRDALALATGKRTRLTQQEIVDREQARRLAYAFVDLGLRHAAIAQAVSHVVVNAHMRIERVVLEHHGDVAVGGLDLVYDAVADFAFAAGYGLEASDHAQQRGLAAAGRTEQHGERSIRNSQR